MDVNERDGFLRRQCSEDDALRQEVEAMLAAREEAANFMEAPALAVTAIRDANDMALPAGTKLGPYEILAAIGAGGMGEVYRARDTKLKREVAVKVLPDEFSNDPERVRRFQREAEALAALNHQNIAGIYDLQQSGTTRFLILEFVEGNTLADILAKRGALPLDEALNIARQICDALEAAHERGIVHRDLKPGNVMITANGRVKVLDFGLAKVFVEEGSTNLTAMSGALATPTGANEILGTAPYMSPEQARGKAVDKRTDIWAFGCVLYEALTGCRAFAAETTSDTIAKILEHEPDWNRLPEGIPAALRLLLRRCLEKDSARRLRDIGDARIELEDRLSAGLIDSKVGRKPAMKRVLAI